MFCFLLDTHPSCGGMAWLRRSGEEDNTYICIYTVVSIDIIIIYFMSNITPGRKGNNYGEDDLIIFILFHI
jgi:hypothetical protein